MKKIITLLFFLTLALSAMSQTAINAKQLRLMNNTDSVGLGSTTGIFRYDPVTGKYRLYNALTSTWFSYEISGVDRTTFSNGLTKVGYDGRLGGTLTSSTTTLSGTDKRLAVTLTNSTTGSAEFSVSSIINEAYLLSDHGNTVGQHRFIANSSGAEMSLLRSGLSTIFRINTTNGAVFTDQRVGTAGITYAADYSSGYTSRSLVDKGYVDSSDDGITSLNSLTGSSQTFAVGTSGSSFGISSIGTTHTFNMPDATADGSTTKGQARFTQNDFDASAGQISIDYTNGQAASGSTKGFLTSADWTTFNNKGSGSVTSVGLSTGTTGTDVNVSGSPVTGSGTITLNIPTASASNRGVLSTSDWSTFNSKLGGTAGLNEVLVGTGSAATSYSGLTYDNNTGALTVNRAAVDQVSDAIDDLLLTSSVGRIRITGQTGGAWIIPGVNNAVSLEVDDDSGNDIIKAEETGGTRLVTIQSEATLLNSGSGDVNFNIERSGGTASDWKMYLPTGTAFLRFNNGSSDILSLNTGNVSTGASNGFEANSNNGSNSSLYPTVQIKHATTGSPAAGIGPEIDFWGETAEGLEHSGMGLAAEYTDISTNSQDVDFVVKLESGGTEGNERFRVTSGGLPKFNSTITPGGTTGDQTINKATGTVNFAASATTLTVTNSLVTTSSIVLCVVRTNDTTATIKNVVPGSGSFVITLSAAATAETSVGFFVVN